MTVGKFGEVKLNCGGVVGLTVAAAWEERVDEAAGSSCIAVTGMTVAAEERGRYTLSGTVSVDGAVSGRLTDCVAEVTEENVPINVTGGSFPLVSAPVFHKERDAVGVTIQLSGMTDAGQSYHASGLISVELTTQLRVSQVVAGDSVVGMAMTIGILPVDSGAVHVLGYEMGAASGEIGTGLKGGNHTWTPPMELCREIPDANEGGCRILCHTYRSDVLVGTASCEVSLRAPLTTTPVLTDGWVRLEPFNEGTGAEGMDCYVQGFSGVRAVFDESKIDLSNAYGGTLAAFGITVGGADYAAAPYVSSVLHSYGVVPVGCFVKDSRGRVLRETVHVTVLPYMPPVLGDVEVLRCDANGVADEQGDSLSVSAGFGACALGGRNWGRVKVSLRSMRGVWSEPVTLETPAPTVLWTGQISPNAAYEVRLEVVDTVGGSASVTVTLPSINVFFHGRSGGQGAAFGKRAEADDVLEVAWSLKTKGDLVVEGTATIGGKQLWEHLYPVGAVCSCDASADPSVLFGGTWIGADTTVRHWVRTE